MLTLGVSLSPTKSDFGPLLFSGDLQKGLENIAKLGYAGVELSLLDSNTIDQKWLMNMLSELELKAFAIATGQTYVTDRCALYAWEERERHITVERLKGHIDFAVKLDCSVIIGGIRGKITSSGDRFQKQLEKGTMALKVCVEYAEKRAVTLLLEPVNRYETNIINTVDEGLKLIEEIGSDSLRLLPDTFHMNIEERSFEDSLTRAGALIGYIHFADSNRLAPGSGHIDFPRILSTLEKIKYTGPVGIEILPKPDDFKAAEQAIKYVSSMTKEMGRWR